MSSKLFSSPTRSFRNGSISDDVAAQGGETALPELLEFSFVHDEPALPVVAAIDHHEDPSIIDAPEQLPRIGRLARYPHPEDIHRRAEVDRLETARFADS